MNTTHEMTCRQTGPGSARPGPRGGGRESRARRNRHWSLAGLALGWACLGAAGCATGPDQTPGSWATFHLEAAPGSTGGGARPGAPADAVMPVSGTLIPIYSQPVWTSENLLAVNHARVDLGECLVFTFPETQFQAVFRITGANLGRRLVLVVDGKPLGFRRLDGAIRDGRVFFFVERPDGDLPGLAADLQAAAGKKPPKP